MFNLEALSVEITKNFPKSNKKKTASKIIHFDKTDKLDINIYNFENIKRFRTELFSIVPYYHLNNDYLDFKEAVLKLEITIQKEIESKLNYSILNGLVLDHFENYFSTISKDLEDNLATYLNTMAKFLKNKYGKAGHVYLEKNITKFGMPLTLISKDRIFSDW